MRSTSPAVSVILPVYNGSAFLPDALEMLQAQDYQPLEIIVIDDGSTDSTAAITSRYSEVTYIYQQNAGPSSARNRGIRAAQASYISFLDVDDLYPPGKIRFQVDYLEAHPEFEVVMGGIKYVLLDEARPSDSPLDHPDQMRAFVNLGAGLFRRSIFDRIGFFAEDLHYSEDVDWFLRALENDIKLSIVKSAGLLYRRHGESMTRKAGEARMKMNMLRVLHRSMQRRRQPDGSILPLPDWASFFDDELKEVFQKGVRQGLFWTE